jgi:hypothetical protein
MAVTNFSPLLGLALPTTGDLSGTWGTTVNDSITQLLDSAVAGTTTLSADADVTLSTTNGAANQARNAVILWTASNGATTRNITAPAQSKAYTVLNAGTGSIVLRGAGPTTGVTIVSGETCVVAWAGADFVKVATSVADGVATISFGSTGLTPSTATSGAVTVAGTLAIANGGTGATTASAARTALGATTLGSNLVTITNPSAVTFPQFNANNTVSSLDAASFRTAIGAGSGGGSVTTVGWTGGIVTVTNPTTTPAFTIAGTSGGVPYFNSGTTWATSAALAASSLVIGGGAGAAPATTTTGTGVVTAVGSAVNTTGGLVTQSGTLAASALLLGGGASTAIASTTTGAGVVTALGVAANAATGFITGDGTATLSNKRIDPRNVVAASASTLTPDVSVGDIYAYTALAAGLTINAPIGTPTDGDKLIFRLLDNGTARALTWNATYTVIGVTLPTTTVINKTTYVGCIYNANNTRWDVIAVTTQA